MGDKWQYMPFSEAVVVNPSVSLKRGETYPYVDMQAVDPSRPTVGPSRLREFAGGGSRFEPYDTLMARITPCLENGKIARYVPDDEYFGPAFGSTEFIVIRGKEGVTDNDFVFYLTRWREFRSFAIAQMTGSSGRQRVPAESLAGFEVPVPPLPEQRAIARILGTLDDKIELNRRMNETLEAMAQALFKSWFVDFDPVVVNAIRAGNPIPEKFAARAAHYRANPDALGLPEHILRLFPARFVDSELDPIPEGGR
ncbi:restriction endonuclease subunit S [Rhodothermus marinus]|uniref:restriction endonuclease subunit S n=1 Tax=Rhodothermus marinus TaxID=29549 RepID=UPI000AA4BB62